MDGFKITLKAARINAGYTLKTASECLGIALSTLHSYEKGETFPNAGMVNAICALYKIPYDYIFFGDKSALSGQRKERKRERTY